MKKLLITSIIACSAIPLAGAQSGGIGGNPGTPPPTTSTTTFSYDNLAKMVEYNFERGQENIVDLAEKLFPGANKTFTFFTKFKDGAVIDKNMTLDGNNLKIAENIPAGKYDVPLSICQEIDDNTTLKTTSFDAQLEYNYMGPPVRPLPPPPPPPPQPAPIEDDVLDL